MYSSFLKPAIFFLIMLSQVMTFSQGINTDFGQNRVQYKEFTWSFYESRNFVTYFYLGGQELGRFTAQVAEQELGSIERALDYKINSRIEILVYNDLEELNQSNIGVGLELNNVGGVTQIIGNKVFIHFNGNHRDLQRQIREGIAKVLINNMIFGGSVQEVLQNSVLLNLPDWFVSGLVSYIGENWNSEYDSRLKDNIISGRYEKFNRLRGDDARLAGHSFWYFVSEVYGKEAIPNMLYLTRINRSIDNAFLFVLNFSQKEAIQEWHRFYLNRYIEEDKVTQLPEETLDIIRRRHSDRKHYNIRINPQGTHLAYVSNDMGRYRIHLVDLETNKRRVIFRGGFKTQTLHTDENYPLMAWDPTGRSLVIFHERRDVIRVKTYDMETGKLDSWDEERFQRVIDVSFTNDPRQLLLSAINRGQSDIYYYNLHTKNISRITNDPFDNLQPNFVDFGKWRGVMFVSNRTTNDLQVQRSDTIIPIQHFNLYFLNTSGRNRDQLLKITHSSHLSEQMPMQLDGRHFAFLSDENGIRNRYAGYIDSIFSHYDQVIYYDDGFVLVNPEADLDSLLLADEAIIDSFRQFPVYKDTAYVFPLTNMARNIEEQDILYRRGTIVDMIQMDGRPQFVFTTVPEEFSRDLSPVLPFTTYRTKENRRLRISDVPSGEPEERPLEDGHSFQTTFGGDTTMILNTQRNREGDEFRPGRVLPYRTKFSTEYVLTQLDNSIIITPYQNFVGYGPVYQMPSMSGFMTLSISDLFENYRFTGGFRMPTTFNGSEYYLAFDNNKDRLNKRFMYYRKADFNSFRFANWNPEVYGRQKTNYIETRLVYPLDVLRSFRGTFGLRNYRIEFLASDTFSMNVPHYQENWISGKLEYVFDNTIEVGLNILNGTRYKFYYEIMNQFDAGIEDGINIHPSRGILNVLGTDIRHYQKIHRNIIWANRFAGATSFGNKKLIYYLGGVDNWMMAKFDHSIGVNFDNNYAFQTLATNMRGHRQNIRNGNSYAVLNSELRIPIFSYLFNTPIKSEFIRNFQIVGFGDLGTAWEGPSPFDDENPFNVEYITEDKVTIRVEYFRNPIVGGYGFGARSVLFGYFIRADVAWGVDTGIVSDPIWYFSLNLDF